MTRLRAAQSFASLLLFCCSAVLLFSPRGLAQQPQLPAAAPRDGVPIFYAEFGWGGQFPGDHWGPVTVWATGGEEAFSGVMTAEYPQDSTQSARVAVPFATTPGKTTPIRFVLALPTYVGEISFTLRNEAGRPLRTLTYAAAPSDTEALLQPFVPGNEGLLVSVGRTSLNEASRGWSSAADPIDLDLDRARFRARTTPVGDAPLSEAQLRAAWANARASRVEPAALPLAAVAYDGVLALVVEAGAAAQTDPRAIEVIHQWVLEGGRLVVIADTPGAAWRSWLPPGPEGERLNLRPIERGPLPADIKAAIDRTAAAAAERERARREPGAEALDNGPADPLAGEPIPSAVRTLQRRLITLTDAAAADGWILRWADPDDPSAAALAEGPVGLGWVTVLGIDPQRTSEVLSTRASAAVWRDALSEAISDWLRSRSDAGSQWSWGGWNPNLGGRSRALAAALTSLAGVPMTSDSLFVAIAGAMALLALLVGPGDYFILRRLRAHQRSWLTALLWITLASVGAYAAPRMLRSGPTQIHRFTTTDRLVRPGDAPAAPAAQTGVTGIFAAESGPLAFTQLDHASWWRGVSAADTSMSDARPPASLVLTTQAPGSTEHGNPLERLGLSLWTFRTFMDRAHPATSLNARLRPAPAGEGWRLTVVGLPQGARIDNAVVRLGKSWIPLNGADAAALTDGRWETSFSPPSHPTVAPMEWLAGGTPQSYDPWGDPAAATVPDLAPGDALALAGPDRRTLAIDRRVATGNWACVQLQLKDLPPDIAVDRPARHDRTAVVRLVVPVEGAAPARQENQP